MVRRGFLTGVASLLVLVIAVGVVGAGDRDIAELLYGKGEKAYRKKAYEEAAGHFERALDEHSPYPEAAFKLGLTLEKLGKGKEALDAYLLAQKHFGELDKLSRKQKRTLSSVKKNISRIGAGYAELSKLDAAFVKKCVALSRRYFNSRPAWAKKAAESALAIDPGNELAKGFLDKLGSTEGPKSGSGLFEPCILDDSLKGWNPGIEEPWGCRGGVLFLDSNDGQGHANYVKRRLEKKYEIQAEFRGTLIDRPRRLFGLMFGYATAATIWSLVYDGNDELVLVRYEDSECTAVRQKLLPPLRKNRWYRIGVRIEDGKLTALLDGKVAFVHRETSSEIFDGIFGLIGQNMKLEVKNLEVRE